MARSPSRLVRLLFAAAGVLLLVAGVLLLRDRSRVSGGVRVEGVVVALESRLGRNHEGFAPVVSFESGRGPKRITGEVASFPAEYALGDRVGVIVNREDAEKAVLDSFEERHFLTTLFGGLGLLLATIAAVELIRARRA